MNSIAGTVRLRAVALATAAMLVSVPIFGLVANAQGSADHSDLEHHHGFTGPGAESDWPPRPTGATGELNPVDAQLGFAAAAGLQAFQAESLPAPDAAALDALGNDWLHISYAEAIDGKDGYLPAEDTYFSRDKNQTVIVRYALSGTDVVTIAPEQLQPVVTEPEEIEAAELGRQWLVENGFDAAADYEGFAIRALDDGEFYPVRMVYVTFATSWFDDPEYSALVDLTNGVVVEGRAL